MEFNGYDTVIKIDDVWRASIMFTAGNLALFSAVDFWSSWQMIFKK